MVFKRAVLIRLLSQHSANGAVKPVESLSLLQVKTYAVDVVPILTASTLDQNSTVVSFCLCLNKRFAAETEVRDGRHGRGRRVVGQHHHRNWHRVGAKSKNMAAKCLPLFPKLNVHSLNLAKVRLDLSNILLHNGFVVQKPIHPLLKPCCQVKDLAQEGDFWSVEPKTLSFMKAPRELIQSGARTVASDDKAQVTHWTDVVRLQAGLPFGDAHTGSMVPFMTFITLHHHPRLWVSAQTIDWLLAIWIHGLRLRVQEGLGCQIRDLSDLFRSQGCLIGSMSGFGVSILRRWRSVDFSRRSASGLSESRFHLNVGCCCISRAVLDFVSLLRFQYPIRRDQYRRNLLLHRTSLHIFLQILQRLLQFKS